MTKVAINGFGRIGRLVFRGLLDRTDLDIVAINNPSGPETAAYLLKYDTVHGRLNKKVELIKMILLLTGNASMYSRIGIRKIWTGALTARKSLSNPQVN